MKKRITKRQFFRQALAGTGGVAFGISSLETVAKSFIPMDSNSQAPADIPDKYIRESPFYILTPKGVKCQICPNQCILTEGKESLCRTKFVQNDRLYTMAYGNPCAVHVDPVEKKPLFHFHPSTKSYSIATAGCNLACLNCQNWEISQVSPKETRNIEMFPLQVVQEAISSDCQSIAYTYSEPIAFYEYMYDTAKLARSRGISNLFISNGYINEKPLRELAGYLDGANINLKSFKEEIYLKLNGGGLEPILTTLKILKEMGVWLEITNLIVPRWTDNLEMIRQMCVWLAGNGFQDTPLHFSRFFPLYKLTTLPFTPLSVLEQAHEIARSSGLNYVYIGNVPNTSAENTFCPKCGKVVIERRGYAILENNIQHGKCKFCGTSIAGRWS